MIEIRHLRHFIAVAEERHFSRAAQRLHIAQPALSHQIRALEAELGVRLINRDKRPIELTDAGEAFLQGARESLHQLEQARYNARQVASGRRGRIRVGVVASATYSAVPAILRRYCKRYPAVRLSVRELSSPAQLDALRDGEIQIAFLRPPVVDDSLSVQTLVQEPFVLALPDDHPLAHREAVSLSALDGFPLVLFKSEEGPGFREQIIHLCHQAGYRPRTYQQASQMDGMLSLVAAGVGVAVVPKAVERVCLENVRYVPISDETPPAELCVAWRASESTPSLLAMVAMLDERRVVRAEGKASKA